MFPIEEAISMYGGPAVSQSLLFEVLVVSLAKTGENDKAEGSQSLLFEVLVVSKRRIKMCKIVKESQSLLFEVLVVSKMP